MHAEFWIKRPEALRQTNSSSRQSKKKVCCKLVMKLETLALADFDLMSGGLRGEENPH